MATRKDKIQRLNTLPVMINGDKPVSVAGLYSKVMWATNLYGILKVELTDHSISVSYAYDESNKKPIRWDCDLLKPNRRK